MDIPVVTGASEFKTITENDEDEFDKKINRYLRDGWKLFGVPYMYEGATHVFSIQHLIKQ